jgi:hypothetical protein
MDDVSLCVCVVCIQLCVCVFLILFRWRVVNALVMSG